MLHGRKTDWENNVFIDTNNDGLKNATIHFLKDPKISTFSVSDWGNEFILIEIITENVPKNSIIYLAAYKDNNFSQIKSITLDESGTKKTGFNSNGENNFKLFILDNLQNLTPLCKFAETHL